MLEIFYILECPNPSTTVATTVCLTLLPILICVVAGICINVKRKYR